MNEEVQEVGELEDRKTNECSDGVSVRLEISKRTHLSLDDFLNLFQRWSERFAQKAKDLFSIVADPSN